ncbi:MAG TPA: hypothetical protein PK358_16220 [Spirochaetota bacterium]|nr:hypothetical protein [Spirochaetota bacterium]HPJ36385.1 hypothetical protein [Spirochaetota bacterium]
MKKPVFLTITALILISMTLPLSARTGISIGVFGAYSTDCGAIEEKINEATARSNDASDFSSEHDTVMVPGAGLFARYDLTRYLFIRGGAEYYELTSGGDIKKHEYYTIPDLAYDYEYSIEYSALAFPLFIGLTVSPDRGRTAVYAACGAVISRIDMSYEMHEYDSTPHTNDYDSDGSTTVIGAGGIFGIERRVFSGFYFMLEYAMYRCETNEQETMERIYDGFPTDDVEYSVKYGLPREQLRVALRYAF